MSVHFKDYYQTLGVEKKATTQEIKKAYRNLARENHPDKAPEGKREQAEVKIKEINEAYAVLKDEEKRKKYDMLGPDWENGGGFGGARRGGNPYSGMSGGADEQFEFNFGGTGFSDFFEQMFGSRSRRQSPFGGFAQREPKEQSTESDISVPLEEIAKGGTRVITLRRKDLESGTIKTQQFRVRIPKGVKQGQKLRISGQGNSPEKVLQGELFLKVNYAPHPDFNFEDGKLNATLKLAPWEAVLGGSFEIPTLEGSVRIKIKPGTSSGQLRLKGQGLPQGKEAGDLIVKIQVEVPKEISAEEKKVWEGLSKISSFNPRE